MTVLASLPSAGLGVGVGVGVGVGCGGGGGGGGGEAFRWSLYHHNDRP